MATTASSPSRDHPSFTASFTAIVPVFNDAARVPRSLATLKAQTAPFDEIIVIDDASTDDSAAVIEAIIQDMPNARLLRNPRNLGVVGALNVGIAAAAGDFVFLASANDSYANRMVEWAREMLAAHPEAVLVCGNSVIRSGDGAMAEIQVQLPQRRACFTAQEVVASARFNTLGFASGAYFIATSALRWTGGLDPALRWNSDWFVLCLLALTRGCCVIPEQLAQLDGSRESYSRGVERWSEQREVTLAFLRLLKARYPEALQRFRTGAVLPRHTPRELALILSRRELWPYVTPRLVRRCLEETLRSQWKRCRTR